MAARAAPRSKVRAPTTTRPVATYRQTVLTAFQQVEDGLVQQRLVEQQEKVQEAAVAAAREAERLSLNQYRAGTIPYTTVITTQTTALSAEQTLINIRADALQHQRHPGDGAGRRLARAGYANARAGAADADRGRQPRVRRGAGGRSERR